MLFAFVSDLAVYITAMLASSGSTYEGLTIRACPLIGVGENKGSVIVIMKAARGSANWYIKPLEPLVIYYFDNDKKWIRSTTTFVPCDLPASIEWVLMFRIPLERVQGASSFTVNFGASGLRTRHIFVP